MIETFMNRGMDILGVQETHMRGSGMLECKVDGERGVWEDMEGGVVWSGMKEGSRGRGKEVQANVGRFRRLWVEGDEDNMG